MDRGRLGLVAVWSAVLGVATGVGAAMFFDWRGNRVRVAELSAGMASDIMGGPPVGVEGVPPVWPGWLLVGVAVLAGLVAVAAGIAWFVTATPTPDDGPSQR